MKEYNNHKLIKNVGILNVQHVNNYGAVLLCYALQETVKKLGYKAEVIDYRPNKLDNRDLVSRIKNTGMCRKVKDYLKTKIRGNKRGVNNNTYKKDKVFYKFKADYLNRSKIYIKSDKMKNLDYDAYIVGSDVVWKPGRINSDECEVYFLDFTKGKNCKRIAYAASIGTDDKKMLESVSNKIQSKIDIFDSVSTREKTTVPYLEKLYNKKVEWCIDPTLLLEKEDYEAIISAKNVSDEYIYLYMFENSDKAYELANEYSRKLGLPIICQCGDPDKLDNVLLCSRDDGPIEFINRIKNANFVITDSFHGTVFSTIFEKDFITLSRGNISIRMQDFLERLQLTDRFISLDDISSRTLETIDFKNVKHIIKQWREESLDYLYNSLQ